MCGIIGYIGSQKVVPILIDGLRRLDTAATTRRGSPSSGTGASICAAAPASSPVSRK